MNDGGLRCYPIYMIMLETREPTQDSFPALLFRTRHVFGHIYNPTYSCAPPEIKVAIKKSMVTDKRKNKVNVVPDQTLVAGSTRQGAQSFDIIIHVYGLEENAQNTIDCFSEITRYN